MCGLDFRVHELLPFLTKQEFDGPGIAFAIYMIL